MLPIPCTKNTPISVCVYIYSAHSVLRVYYIQKKAAHACCKNLRTPATISRRLFAHFCSWKHSASMGLQHAGMNVSAGLSLLFPFSCECFRVVKAGQILVPAPATGHRGQCYDHSHTHASLLRDACMLIMIRKR